MTAVIDWDVIVVGAGPAGLQCARSLSKAGRKVLVAERHATFLENNFSSAGTVPEILSDFELPAQVVGSGWKKLTIVTSESAHSWTATKEKGLVLDFAELKTFLTSEIENAGGSVLMARRFKEIRPGQASEIIFQTAAGCDEVHRAPVIVDATGPLRGVMRQVAKVPSDLMMDSVGVEYLVEVSEKDYRAQEMIFFVGKKWIPGGYSWIFPMKPCLLKIGAGYLTSGEGRENLKFYADKVIQDYLKLTNYKVLDFHGGRLSYCKDQKDIFHAGSVVAVGDTVSAVNPLGGEGIRHAMWSGQFAAEEIQKKLQGQIPDFSAYEKRMRDYFGTRWKNSQDAAVFFYEKFSDPQISLAMKLAHKLSLDQVIDVLFYYNFGKGILSTVLKAFRWLAK